MWIVKIGGSLLGSPELVKWLEILVKFSDGKIIIVPGGGLFANSVREAQKVSNVSDAVAHQLALLAMDQYGIMLAGMNSALVTASSELEIAERGWQHRGIVWLPSKMALADSSIPNNWHVTSDSLSAWLANKLGAEQLILVKSKPLITYQTEAPSKLQNLVDDELIDRQFINFIQSETSQNSYQAWVLNKADYTIFEQGFSLQKLKETGLLINSAVT
ncbi:uridylate kinase [Methylotenera sp.]|uniref:amino acid kinase family protein n=1 Tax=Methylotenera sp. TaxID=2051956 RepID=UPI0027183539|nr:uridylate kinase [Methylotenera sp.]MDO9204490.1 uridylate kinase [Methylotenera sp.]MDO9392447.1 uridylate kinase [Methylotenera sp.]MDP1521897.1 uridylate kinase [Methylotenera sp.]MDP2072125.1 uridylate kinase [Methylotenera sp.]MDP2231701.1 uridylate kinase [Methylotenera sp.]